MTVNEELSEEVQETNPVHEVDENPEEHAGEQIKDPWADPEQTDWSMNQEENN